MLDQEDKIEKIYFSISDVSKMFNVNPSLVRFWEKEFSILTPRKNKRGDRFYDKENIEAFRRVHKLIKEEGYKHDGARKIIDGSKKEIKATIAARETLIHVKSFLEELQNTL